MYLVIGRGGELQPGLCIVWYHVPVTPDDIEIKSFVLGGMPFWHFRNRTLMAHVGGHGGEICGLWTGSNWESRIIRAPALQAQCSGKGLGGSPVQLGQTALARFSDT